MTFNNSSEPDSAKVFNLFTNLLPDENIDRFIEAKGGTKQPDGKWITKSPNNVGQNSLIKSGDGLLIIDVDDWSSTPENIRDLLNNNPTLTVQSPHSDEKEGHYYYLIDCFPSDKQELPKAWGEIKHGMLAVTPGSEITECKHGCCSERIQDDTLSGTTV